MGLKCIFSCLKWTVIIAVIVFGLHIWLNSKRYLISHESVAAIAKKHIDKGDGKFKLEKAFSAIHQDLSRKYPGHILPKKDLQWMFMNAGGWMGSMCLLHASMTEYVLLFGTAVDTEGHSGRYWANITDTLLTGEFRQWLEGEFKVHKHNAGSTVAHAWGEVTAVNFAADTWMVEYGRGFIPSTLTFALADTFFSTTDFLNLFYILRIYGKAIFMETSLYITQLVG